MSAYVSNGLPKDWVYSSGIDLELKQYTLLAYLQRVNTRFAERKLYPYLEHVQEHVDELLRLQRKKAELSRNLTGPLLGFDPRTGHAIHADPVKDELLDVIDEVIDFAVPGLQQVLSQGHELRRSLVEGMRSQPVGLLPLHTSEGWLLLNSGRETRVYAYSIPVLQGPHDGPDHRSVSTRYVTTYTVGFRHTYERIKAELIGQFPSHPNPATFVFESELPLPCIETFVPLAKRAIHAQIRAARNGTDRV